MKRFACWDAREVGRTIVDDANRDAPAVFSAVHRPARVLRKDIRRAAVEEGTPVHEHDVLDALLGGDASEDRIVPIVGESGTGKSHLIRWLDAHIERRPDRHVVYIEKRGTSLRRVIHEILGGLDDPNVRHRDRFRKLRGEVDKASAGLDPDTARLRLLTELSLAVREHGLDNSASEDERADREELLDKGLPDLLTDPEFREPLLGDRGVIAETVDTALGRGESDGEAPAFTELRLDIADVMRAGATARALRQDLYGDPELLALTIQMLNEQLNPALGALIGVDRKQVYDVMLDVREALRDEGKTLVLLVEDFALLRGVETQLLDAMIADQQSRGEDVLCPMRSALAVTSGYFEGKETALTRIHSRGRFIYSLDASLGGSETGVSPADVHAFVATYLNAARVGRAGLTARFDERRHDSASDRDWVPNGCESCRFEGKCHPAFGAADGYGLYPFNAAALDRIVSSQMDRFDPRHILQILEDTLRTQRQALVDGEFPDPSWAAEYDQQRVPGEPDLPVLPAAVGTTYEDRDPGTAERRKTLATFWGRVPQQAVNLDPTIHEAFDLPPLPDLPRLGQTEPPGEPGNKPKSETPADDTPDEKASRPADAAQERDRRALDAWARGQVLEQELANRVRRALAAAVRGAREWSCYGVDERTLERVVGNQAFSLGGKAKGEASAATNPIGFLQPSDSHAFLLQGVLDADRTGDWSFERGLERLAQFSDLVDAWAEEALRRLETPAGDTTSLETETIVQLLLMGSVVLGLAGPEDSDQRLLESLFESPRLGGSGRWREFQQRIVEGPGGTASRADLQAMLQARCSVRRSVEPGKVIAIDGAPLLTAITALRDRQWAFPDMDALAEGDRVIRQHGDALRRDLEDVVRVHLRDLATRRRRDLELLGENREPPRVIEAANQALGAARDNGVGASMRGTERAELEAHFIQADLGALDRLDGLERLAELSWPDTLALLVMTANSSIDPIDDYLVWADELLGGSLEQVSAALGGGTGDDDGVTATTAQLVITIQEIVQELRSEGL